ncbi:MAG: pyruvate dehydrogenase (acetyl-transferring) E1 component subunit alpha [Candidatus Auribacterota bacterium]|jgi:pyruvate dehydrogenase E1 component alpha subunit|nr:pyruvate dehydrogenase (acetyl-transferring) E1 component subunit alpha [Candidatus Auribacterota bacterium]
MGDIKDLSKYDKKTLKKFMADMLLIRRFEEKCAQMYGLQKIGGFCHLYIGQEAVAVGSIGALDLKTDYVLTGYRDHAHALACGLSADSVMAELFGKETGCSRGKGGSMHLFDVEHNMLGGNGIVGGHIPVATGVAFKIRYNREKGVVLCFFGDGAIHQGAFHESLNMAKIWNLPILYICENNQYGMGTMYKRVSSVDDFSLMAASYGMQGKQIDGMDVLNVFDEVSATVNRIRNDNIPALLEIKTYRYKGHSMSDPAQYRTREELEEYKKLDPIVILKIDMMDNNLLTEDEFKEMDKQCKAKATESVTFAEQSAEPQESSLYEDVLV